jgi:hypothetical protein
MKPLSRAVVPAYNTDHAFSRPKIRQALVGFSPIHRAFAFFLIAAIH